MKLKKGQIVYINNEKNVVINMIEFKEDTWIWQEYEIINTQTNKHTWLSIEPNEQNQLEYYLYKQCNKLINDNDIEFWADNRKYKLYESGSAIVENYFGNADVDRYEQCKFFDYICDEDNSIISVEVWEDEREQSIGYKIPESSINISEEVDETISTRKRNVGGIITGVCVSFLVLISIIIMISFEISGNKSMRKYIEENSSKYSYVTSITNNQNNKKAKVYKSKYSTIDETVKDIIDGAPAGITKTIDLDETTQEDGIGLETKKEYAYIYEEGGDVYVQISEKKYVNNSGTTYHSSHKGYYHRTYNSNRESEIYSNYANSARQNSVNSRTSSGGGTSSGK